MIRYMMRGRNVDLYFSVRDNDNYYDAVHNAATRKAYRYYKNSLVARRKDVDTPFSKPRAKKVPRRYTVIELDSSCRYYYRKLQNGRKFTISCDVNGLYL